MKQFDTRTGIGLRHPHFEMVLEHQPPLGWLEVHSENYFFQGSYPSQVLDQLAKSYPISLHGIGLSLGSSDPLNMKHLEQLNQLIKRVNPLFISEHLSWSSIKGRYFNDLLPLPYTLESQDHFCRRVDQVQQYLGRQILIENPSAYISYKASSIPEWDFLNNIVINTGCGLLLDLNNIYVSGSNLNFDPLHYLRQIDTAAVQEIHLAGFTRQTNQHGDLLIDTHGASVHDDVWQLYDDYLQHYSHPYTMIEWDTNIPELEVLLGEAAKIDQHLLKYPAQELSRHAG